MIKDLIVEARPWQYSKNLILFAGLVFSEHLMDPGFLTRTMMAFAAFCLLSSSIYVVNDLVDLERDRLHPQKKNRPLASGRVSRGAAIGFLVFILAVAAFLVSRLGVPFAVTSVVFVLFNAMYTFFLKEIVILDVMAIALSFIIRAIAGVESLKPLDGTIEISPWLLICTLFLALFLGFGKRRHELNLLKSEAGGHRPTLAEYSERFLDTLISVVTGATILAYAIYTVAPDTVLKFHGTNLVYTVPFVIYGVFRYLYLIYERKTGGSPSEIFLTDVPLALTMAGWFGTVLWVIYHRSSS